MAPAVGDAAPCDVLVVDDQPFHRDLVAEMLRVKGLRVTCVASGEEAISAYNGLAEKPVILMDNQMPKMTGIEALRAIKSFNGEAKVIFVSSDVDSRAEAMEAGALGFVTKPFKVAEVLAAVKWAIAYKAPGGAAAGGG
jgi:CheY-like chemotaxis protein